MVDNHWVIGQRDFSYGWAVQSLSLTLQLRYYLCWTIFHVLLALWGWNLPISRMDILETVLRTHLHLCYRLLGVILKMARLIKEGAHCIRGDSVRQAARKPPIKTYVISGKDFVQIVAKVSSCTIDVSPACS